MSNDEDVFPLAIAEAVLSEEKSFIRAKIINCWITVLSCLKVELHPEAEHFAALTKWLAAIKVTLEENHDRELHT